MRNFNRHLAEMAQHINVSEEFIHNLFLITANEFLEGYAINENRIAIWKITPEFWAWWQQIWVDRDRMVLRRYPHRITTNHRKEMYKVWHSPQFIQARPGTKVYRAFIRNAKEKQLLIKRIQDMITNQKVAYYQGSEVRVINNVHPHFNAVGSVLRGEQTPMGYGLVVRRFDTQEHFFVLDENDVKVTKR